MLAPLTNHAYGATRLHGVVSLASLKGDLMLKASVIGNLGNDPEMKYAAGGSAFLRFNVASNFRARTPEGQWEDKTEWVRCTVFGKRAESLADILRKGMRVFVDGRLEARPWTDNNGNVRAGLELVASDVEFMSAKNEDEQRPAQRQRATPTGASDELDEIPF